MGTKPFFVLLCGLCLFIVCAQIEPFPNQDDSLLKNANAGDMAKLHCAGARLSQVDSI